MARVRRAPRGTATAKAAAGGVLAPDPEADGGAVVYMRKQEASEGEGQHAPPSPSARGSDSSVDLSVRKEKVARAALALADALYGGAPARDIEGY